MSVLVDYDEGFEGDLHSAGSVWMFLDCERMVDVDLDKLVQGIVRGHADDGEIALSIDAGGDLEERGEQERGVDLHVVGLAQVALGVLILVVVLRSVQLESVLGLLVGVLRVAHAIEATL